MDGEASKTKIVSGVEIENRFVASLWGLYLVQYWCVYKLLIEGGYFCVAQISQIFWSIKTNFYRPTTIPVLSASGEQEEVVLSLYEEAAEDLWLPARHEDAAESNEGN